VVDVRRSQADADGMSFGYLGIRISGAEVWTIGRGSASRYLGPLKDASAGIYEPHRAWIGTFVSGVLLGETPPKGARLYVDFAGGTRYERLVLPFMTVNWANVGGEIGRFNAAAYLAPGPAESDSLG
jgi:hypothetical protein